jgi:hypothetical protein
MNLARIKFFVQFICALCKVQNVCFEKLAAAFDTSAEQSSSLRRIQRFMSEYYLDRDLVARLIFALLPSKSLYTLAMDRTNWKFGKTNINALVLAVTYQGVAFPLLFTLLDKQGNSSTDERISLMERFIALFGRDNIECLVADREFVGQKWLEYLNTNGIRYHIRIRNNFKVKDPRAGKELPVWWLFNGVCFGQVRVLDRIFYINDCLCYLSGSRIKAKDGAIEYQIIVSFNKQHQAHQKYKERWQIETAFKALKSSGFDIEKTHLTQIDRLEKLFSLVIIAFTWAYLVGLHVDKSIKQIRILKHGYKAKTYFKLGLNTLARLLLNNKAKQKIPNFFLSCS